MPRPRAASCCTAPPTAACMSRRAIGDYTDFFAGINHATNAGKLFRPDNPLMPNYKYVPIGYHGRASSIGASGAEVRRPDGQRKPANETVPDLRSVPQSRLRARTRRLDRPRQRPRSPDPDRARPRTTSRASACSTTGRRATSRAGSTSRSARSSARASAPPSRPGWSRRKHWRRSACRRRRGPRATRRPCPICSTRPTRPEARSTSRSRSSCSLPAMQTKGPAAASAVGRQRARPLLDGGQLVAHHTSNGCNLRAGRHFRHRDHFRHRRGQPRQPAGNLRRRPSADDVYRQARRRRFLEDGDTVIMRAPAGTRDCLHRLWRVPRHHRRAGALGWNCNPQNT